MEIQQSEILTGIYRKLFVLLQYADPKMAGPSLIRPAIFGSAYCIQSRIPEIYFNNSLHVLSGIIKKHIVGLGYLVFTNLGFTY